MVKSAKEAGFRINEEVDNIDEEISQILFIAKQLNLRTNIQLIEQVKSSSENTKAIISNMVSNVSGWTGNEYFVTKIGLLSFLSDDQCDNPPNMWRVRGLFELNSDQIISYSTIIFSYYFRMAFKSTIFKISFRLINTAV